MTEAVGCPLCRGRTRGAHRAREMMFGSRDPFSYGECADCGTLVLIDPPDDLSRYYPDDYYSLKTPPSRAGLVAALKRLRAAAALRGLPHLATLIGGGSPPIWMDWLRVAGLDRSASICDIGCGGGELLFDLAAAGFEGLVGIDPFVPEPVERDGVRILKATVAEAVDGAETASSGLCHLVMFNHSFEHLADPLADLAAARDLLAPAGTLMIRTPVAGCWAWRHYGTDWVGLDPPRHLFVPSPEGLAASGASVGLDLYATRYDSTAMQFWRSEQYQRDIALFEPSSHQVDPAASPFSRTDLRRWRREAARLNAAADGDTAAFFLRRVGAS